MRVKYPEVPRVSGVYQIVNLVNGKRYVGSSINIRNRWLGHVNSLNKNKHHCAYLQRAWNHYGEENFAISVLEECPKEENIFWEQLHMDERCDYNTNPVAASSLGVKRSEGVKSKLSAIKKELYKSNPSNKEHLDRVRGSYPKPQHWKDALSARFKGVRKTPEQIEKAGRSKAKISEEKVRQIIDQRLNGSSLEKISESFGISWTQAQRICSGKRYRWIDGEITPEKNKEISLLNKTVNRKKKFSEIIYSFHHELHGERNCRQVDLRHEFPELLSKNISGVCRGNRRIHKGWTIKKAPD